GDKVKILTWDRGGFVLFYKRLEQGRFRLPAVDEDALGVQLDSTQLAMLLDGIDYSRVRRPKTWLPPLEEQGSRQVPQDLIQPGRRTTPPGTNMAKGGKGRGGSARKPRASKSGSTRSKRSLRSSSSTSSASARRRCRASKTS